MTSSASLERRLVLLLAAASLACAPAPRSGDEVRIAEESAIIIWDSATRTQHFIRRASFETKAKDFGFLVPTPSVPKLGEADDEAFSLLDRITEPPHVAPVADGRPVAAKMEVPRAPHVIVIAREKVAGLDAAVLKANDAGALDYWMKENGYNSSPELADWYKPYIAKNWIITAFKIASDGPRANSPAVRMSFQTEQPFFPYREPAGTKSSGSRQLEIYFISDTKPEGRIGASGEWPGKAVWSGPLSGNDRERMMKLVGLDKGPASSRLTRFRDNSSPRPGTDDLYFQTAADQSDLGKVPEGSGGNFLAMILIAAGLVAMFILFLRWRRARSSTRRDPTSGRP
jgi:Uncharacterized protein conserved in bacteria (DUF2330)